MASGQTPKFSSPPVIETVMGVEFVPIEGWSIPHFGLFWERLRSRLPRVEVHPPIASLVETVGQLAPQPGTRIEFAQPGEVRCWFLNADGSHLVQIQNDRLIFNWRKRGNEAYPGFEEVVRPSFVDYWSSFIDFVSSERLPEPKVIQCELSYVNHIHKGEGWSTICEWRDVFGVIASPDNAVLLHNPESVAFSCAYLLPENRGRLRVEAKHAVRKQDGEETIALSVVSRGRPDSSTLDAILDWFDVGRNWVVQGFADITTEAMHKRWGRQR